MPYRLARLAKTENVPPYRHRCAMTWSPARSRASSTALMAPMPELVAIAAAPPSRSATASSSALVVGFRYRL